jgi:hypothetical protein
VHPQANDEHSPDGLHLRFKRSNSNVRSYCDTKRNLCLPLLQRLLLQMLTMQFERKLVRPSACSSEPWEGRLHIGE